MEDSRRDKLVSRLKAGQGEAVAAQVRFRHPQKMTPDWSPWQTAAVNTENPAWAIDSVGYEVEYRLLYLAPPTPDTTQVMVPRELLERHLRKMACHPGMLFTPVDGLLGTHDELRALLAQEVK